MIDKIHLFAMTNFLTAIGIGLLTVLVLLFDFIIEFWR